MYRPKKKVSKICCEILSATVVYLIVRLTHLASETLGILPLQIDQSGSRRCHDQTVTDIAEHDGEKERKSDDSEETRVDFLVRCDTVGIDDRLKTFGKFVGTVESGWGAVGVNFGENTSDRQAGVLLATPPVINNTASTMS